MLVRDWISDRERIAGSVLFFLNASVELPYVLGAISLGLLMQHLVQRHD